MIRLKKGYVLILSLFLILTLSYVSAADNGTDIIKQDNNDLISVDEQDNDSISLSSEAAVINESSNATEKLLGSSQDGEILTVPSSDVLSTCVNVTPLSSSYYKEPTKKERTFNIGGFKVTLTPYKYKKLYQISSTEDEFFDYGYNEYYYVGEKFRGYDITTTGLRKVFTIKTNKFVKVKLKRGNRVYYKNSRVYVIFSYGAGQCGVPYRHMMFLTHHYDIYDRSYDSAGKVLGSNAKYFGKCKQSASFTKLNKSKLYGLKYVYNKYGTY